MELNARSATVVVMSLRIGYGVGLVAVPAKLAERWLGSAALAAPTQVPLRGMGTREVVLHAAVLLAAIRGGPLRPWLAASIAGDLTDVIATAVGREELPAGAALATLMVGGGSALISAGLAAAVDR